MEIIIKKIFVAYWNLSPIDEKEIGIKHLSEYPYSKKKFNLLIHKVINKGFDIKTRAHNEDIVLYIDNKGFIQS